MAQTKPQESGDTEALMREGLDHYAMGDDARAIECWRRVLELEPGHPEASDYLRTATEDVEAEPADPGPEPSEAEAPEPSLLETASELLRTGEAGEALELLETLVRKEPANLAVQGRVDLARARLLDEYRGRLCDGIAVPQLRIAAEEVMKFNLPADAGFVLSSIDGTSSVNDLVDVSGMDPFEVQRTCCRLLDAGIIEVHP